jgi:hypothetical protein
MSRKKRVALVCFDNPFLKPMEGGKRAMLNRIRVLESLDIDLDVYLLCKPAEGEADLATIPAGDNVRMYQHRMVSYPSISMLLKYPICVAKRYVPAMSDQLASNEYDAIIYEGAQVASYRFEGKTRARRHILYYHDIESKYRAQLAASEANPVKRTLQARESRMFAKMENELPNLFDSHLFVSCEERDEFAEAHGLGAEAKYAPYAVSKVADKVPTDIVAGRILYVGDMSLDSNYLSAEWFAREVLPQVQTEGTDVELRLVGRISDEHREHLESLGTRVNVLGYVDDLEAEYQSAACMISPILYGAGVKVKLIDALAKGQIVIANSKACEGTELLDSGCLLVADEPTKMAQICSSVLGNRDAFLPLAEKAIEFIRKNHSNEAQAQLLREEIEA